MLSAKISQLEIVGVDISPTAIALAKQNLHHNIAQGHLSPTARSQIRFVQTNIFDTDIKAKLIAGGTEEEDNWDIIISNPPYISPKEFNKNTSRSVRSYEPKIALVPSPSSTTHPPTTKFPNHDSDRNEAKATAKPPTDTQIGDSFYPQILEIANQVNAKMVLMEVSDLAQAKRVASLGISGGNWGGKCEIWRDWFDGAGVGEEEGEGVGEGEEGRQDREEEERVMVGEGVQDRDREKEKEGAEAGELMHEQKTKQDEQAAEKEENESSIHTPKPPIRIRIIGQGNGRSVFFS